MPVLLRDEWPPFAFGADHFDTMLQGAKGCTEVGTGVGLHVEVQAYFEDVKV